jgi:hypothetical protein
VRFLDLDDEPGVDREDIPSKGFAKVRERERKFRDLVDRLRELADGAYTNPQALGFVGLANDQIPGVLAELGAIATEARARGGRS